MAYYEAKNKKESKEICTEIYHEIKPPYRIQVDRIYPKSEIDADKFFNGPVVRAFMKYTGYTHFTAKAWLAIFHACIKEVELKEKPEIEELFDTFNVYLYNKGTLIYLNERYFSKMETEYQGTLYITQKTSRMSIKRRNEFVDDVIKWLKDQGVKLAKNPNYKDELEF